MSDLRPAGIPIQFGGEERHLLFTLNAMDELQDKFDAPMEVIIDKLLDKRESVRTLRTIMTVLVNDEIRRKKHDGETAQEEFTEEELGWLVHGENVVEITMAVIVAYEISLPEPDEFESPKRGDRAVEAVNIARLIYIGNKKLGYTETEIFNMTLRKFFLIYDEYLEINGLKEKEVTVDQIF